MWCNDFPEIYAQLEEGWGQSAMGICASRYTYMKLIWCNGFPAIYAQLEEGSGVNLPWIYVHCAMYETYLVQWFSRHLCSIGGGEWGQSAMGICALCYIWNLFGVMVFQTSMLNWRRGVGSICHGYMCIVLYMKLIWCNGFPDIYAQLEQGHGVNLPWVYVHCAIYMFD